MLVLLLLLFVLEFAFALFVGSLLLLLLLLGGPVRRGNQTRRAAVRSSSNWTAALRGLSKPRPLSALTAAAKNWRMCSQASGPERTAMQPRDCRQIRRVAGGPHSAWGK